MEFITSWVHNVKMPIAASKLTISKVKEKSMNKILNDIEKLIRNVVKKHAKMFISKKIRIEMNDLNETVLTDREWIFYIIDQILFNSLKYTKEGGKIQIHFEKNKKGKNTIKDNGIGIKEEDLKRVFDKGFTGYNGRDKYTSTGMGLYLAKKLSIKLGHHISLDSVWGIY